MVPMEFLELVQTIVHEFEINNDRVDAALFFLVEYRSAIAGEYVVEHLLFCQEIENDGFNFFSLDFTLHECMLDEATESKVDLSLYNAFLDGPFLSPGRV